MSIIDAPLTAEQYSASPAGAGHTELVRGEVVATMPPSRRHGIVQLALGRILLDWSAGGPGGEVGGEAGFTLRRDPDTVRAPDLYYLRPDNPLTAILGDGFPDGAPDLAVEIVSPSNTAAELRERIGDYLAAGTSLVWTIFPERREVLVHRPDGTARTLTGDDRLGDEAVLPGLTATVADVFA